MQPTLTKNVTAPPLQRPPISNRTNSFGGSSNVTPITMITPYVNKWRICGICTALEGLKDINTKNGPSKVSDQFLRCCIIYLLQVLNFTLTDKEGVSIRIAAFGETAARTANLIQKDCV